MIRKLAAVVFAAGAAVAILSGCGQPATAHSGMVPVNVSFVCPANFSTVAYCDPIGVHQDSDGRELPLSTYAAATCAPNYGRVTHAETAQAGTKDDGSDQVTYTSVTAFFYCQVGGIPAHVTVTYSCPVGVDPASDQPSNNDCLTVDVQDFATGYGIDGVSDSAIAAKCVALGNTTYRAIPMPDGASADGYQYASVTYACH